MVICSVLKCRFGGLSGQDGLSGHLRIFQISGSAAGAENFKKHKKIMTFMPEKLLVWRVKWSGRVKWSLGRFFVEAG